jgi:uncharacterized repeat protein (TIGR01451 family)
MFGICDSLQIGIIKLKQLNMNYKYLLYVSRVFLLALAFLQFAPFEAQAQQINEPNLAGDDGDFTVTGANTVLNNYTVLTADVASGATTIRADADLLNSSNFGNLAVGDLLLIIQMQDATINTSDTISYGNVTALNSAGRYEFVTVAAITNGRSRIDINTTNCPTAGLRNSYTTAGKTQIVRVPQFNNLTVNIGASISATSWNGTVGGIVALQVRNSTIINGKISVDGDGFRGGVIENETTNTVANVPGYRSTLAAFGAEKGEGIAGFQTNYDGTGRYGRGAPANGGGGGNAHNAGGGGGANGNNGSAWTGQGVMSNSVVGASAWLLDPGYIANGNALTNSSGGGRGGYTYSASNQNALTLGVNQPAWGGDQRQERGGLGGRPVDNDPATRLFLGGGGGAGDGNNDSNSGGGRGGGLVILLSDSVSGSGSITANGADALNTRNTHIDAPGGGGAGGTVVVGSRSLSGIAINANGGKGGNQLINADESEGPGGGGGGGYIATSGGAVTRTVNGGSSGTTSSLSLTEFVVNGATNGANGQIGVTASVPICLVSDLGITITNGRTSTQQGQSVTYTITVTNNGTNAVTNAAVNLALPASLLNATWTCALAASCGTSSGTGSIANALVSLDSGATVTFTLSAVLSSTATGTLSNTATVTPPFIATDSVTPNNTATDVDTIVLAPTGASVTVTGQVFGMNGRGLFGATVVLIEANGSVHYSQTNPFGYYRFADLEAGQTVIVNVSHKNNSFAPQILNLNGEYVNQNFAAQP